MKLVLATANPDKAREIAAIAAPSVDLVPRPPDVPDVEETGSTLLDNARLKSEALRDATGLPALADDTGLEVDALEDAGGAGVLDAGVAAGVGAGLGVGVEGRVVCGAGASAPPKRRLRLLQKPVDSGIGLPGAVVGEYEA